MEKEGSPNLKKIKMAKMEEKFHKARNPLHFKKRKEGSARFSHDNIIPSEGEIRLLGNKHKTCMYYNIGSTLF